MSYTYLTVITEPPIEPLNIAEVKTAVHIDHDVEDTLIGSWIKSARKRAEEYMRRAFIKQVLEVGYDFFPVAPFCLPSPPLAVLTSIKYYDQNNAEAEIDLDNVYTDTNSSPGRVDLNYGYVWPTTVLRKIDSVKVRYTAGYNGTGDPSADDVPDYIKDAIFLYCGWRNENRGGETDNPPEQFYNLLSHDRMHF
ncbi:MAG: head-tail connector protein [Bacteroidetes bacterium]|nr:head-tail connector protein [Bacteroidota bacterium]